MVCNSLQEIIDLIMMERTHLKQLADKEPIKIIVPLNKMQVYYLSYTNNSWQVALAYYLGPMDNQYPKDHFLRFFKRYPMCIT